MYFSDLEQRDSLPVTPAGSKFSQTLQEKRIFFTFKRAFDLCVAVLLLPVLGLCAAALLILNPFFNQGPLFYVQQRMGRGCVPFKAIKFRSMTVAEKIERGVNDPLEVDRIMRLGRFIRKSRIDELPQILNVLSGDMSLIGPRPDYLAHAAQFITSVPGYRDRHAVRPGISGLAQTEIGYIEGVAATKKKVAADHYYIAHSGFGLDTWVLFRTLKVIFMRAGA